MTTRKTSEPKWTAVSLEQFFLKETMWMDNICKKVAGRLTKDGTISLLLKSDPKDYEKPKGS